MPDEPVPARVGAAGGQLAAWAVLAIVNAVIIAVKVPLPPAGYGARALHHFYDAGQILCAGLAVSAAVEAWLRWGPRRRGADLAAIAAAAIAVAAVFLAPDLRGAAQQIVGEDGPSPTPVLVAMTVVAGLGIAAAALVGRIASRRRLLAIAVGAAGLGGAIANELVLIADYPGVHLFIAWGSATLLGTALATLPFPARAAGRPSTIARAALAVPCAIAVGVAPSNSIAVDVFRVPGAVIAPMLVRLRSVDDDLPYAVGDGEWMVDRRPMRAIPPSAPRLVPENPIIVMIAVDALRADVVFDPRNAASAPNLHALRDASVAFSHARSPSTSTLTSLASFFSGRYYSGLVWSERPGSKKLYPHADLSPRFPEVLAAGGIDTALFHGMPDATNGYGIVRGMKEEHMMKKKGQQPRARQLADALLTRLKRQRAGGLFVYTHFTDAHVPYNLGGTEGTLWERYLREVTLVDTEIGGLRSAIDELPVLSERVVLIVTADHGEAFGEHGTFSHGPVLYEELVRVPLLIKLPGVAPRVVDRDVTLMDIGPTILDLAGQPTPATFLGESLVPFLRGQDPEMTRPIAVESQRWNEAMIFPDKMKVIYDRRRGIRELYDLAADPGERDNLFDARPEEAQARLGALRAFLGVHTPRMRGYQVPYQ